jgi:hypothetical protein
MVENGYIVWASESPTTTGLKFVFNNLADMYVWLQIYYNVSIEVEKT